MKRVLKLSVVALFVIALTLCFVGCDIDLDDFDIDSILGIFDGGRNNCDGNHDWILNFRNDPTCQGYGNEHYTCVNCGEIRNETLNPTGHNVVTEDGYPATCYESGITDRKYCDRCGFEIEAAQIIPATGHNVVIIEAVSATCTEDGHTEGEECSNCGSILKNPEIIEASHNYEYVEPIAATCQNDGYTEGWICSVCEDVWITPELIPAAHDYIDVWGYGATCTEEGLTDGIKCSYCEEFSVPQVVIPKLDHNTYVVNGYAATCTEDGLSDGEKCYNCEQFTIEQTVIPAGHVVETVPGYAATCDKTGLEDGSVCTVCGETILEQVVIPKIAHISVNVPGYAATCSSNGLTDGVICSVCKTPLTTQHTIVATGHVFDNEGHCTGCSLEATADLVYNGVYDYNSNISAYKVAGLVEGSVVTEVIIPDNYNGLPVIGIEEYAFDGNVNITIVVVPASIVEVGDYAFNGCTSLEEIDCANFTQTNTWNSYWYGDSYAIKITAPVFGDKTPYELYLEAMNNVNHNIDRFVMSNNAVTYISDGITTHKALEIYTLQKQYFNDSYVYQKETDYMSVPNNVVSAEQYYVGEYIYIPQYQQMYYFSLEAYYDMMTINRSDMPEFTEKYFKAVKFRRNIDGTMQLTIEMDEELIRTLIEEVSGIGDVDWNISACTYEYTFDYNGNLSKMISDLTYKIAGNTQYTFNAVSTITLSEVGTFNGIYAPYGYQDVTYYWENQCSNGHNVVECPAVEANCFSNGWTAYSYCDRCFHEIDGMEIIYAGHNYENGECTDCGDFENYYTSQGLAYEFNGEGYIVVGIGNCTDTNVVIPQQIYGCPVIAVSADAFKNTNVYNIQIGSTYFLVDYFYGCDDTSVYWN